MDDIASMLVWALGLVIFPGALIGLAAWLGWESAAPREGDDLHAQALPELRRRAVGNPRLGALLDEIDRGRDREANGPSGQEEQPWTT